jgi:hypothetical protein
VEHALGRRHNDPDAVVACDGGERTAAAAGVDPTELGLGERRRDHLHEDFTVAQHAG